MELDIFNSNPRQVVCVSNVDNGWWSCSNNAHLLTVGQIYNLVDIDVHDWHSLVYLEEFPGVDFNSVLFEEVERIKHV